MVTQTISIPTQMYLYVIDYQKENKIDSFSAAVQDLIQKGRVHDISITAQIENEKNNNNNNKSADMGTGKV